MSNFLPVYKLHLFRVLLFLYNVIILKKHVQFQSFLIASSTYCIRKTRYTTTLYITASRSALFSSSIFNFGLKLWSLLPDNLTHVNSSLQFKKLVYDLIVNNFFPDDII